MKVKRLKRASRVLTFFRYKFGYISPYSILLDGTFCQEALKCKINLREQLPKYLRDENLEMFVTECVMNELEQLGKPLYGALCIAQQFKVAKCPHRPLRSAADCIAHLARRSQNSEKKKIVHYFVATQDAELLQKLRILGGIPLMSIRYNAIILEKPSEETEKLAASGSTTKNQPDEIQKIKELRKIELGEGEEPKHRKRKAKGPNPLSCKKKKKIKKRNLDGSVPGAFGKRKKEGEDVANNTLQQKKFSERQNNSGNIWAVLVAGSNGWWNYRHQADVCHAWHTLINHGVNPENIITMMYDDIANNTQNPHKGKIFNSPEGHDVYEGVRIDYKGLDVTPENFIAVLLGDKEKTGGKRVLESTKNDKVFIYFTDHGATGLIGFPGDILSVKNFSDTLLSMHKKKKYGELTFYLEACESGSMFDEHMPESLKIYAMTAANGHESSWGCYCSTEILPNNCLGDLFSVNWMDDSDKENLLQETLARQFRIVRRKTDKSHVQSFGSLNIKHEHVSEFMGSKEPKKTRKNLLSKSKPKDYPMYPSRDISLFLLAQKLKGNGDNDIMATNALQTLQKKRRYLEKQITQIVAKLVSNPVDQLHTLTIYPQSITDKECHHSVVHTFNKFCFNFSENSYAMKYAFVLTNLCERGIKANQIEAVMKQHCATAGAKTIRGIV